MPLGKCFLVLPLFSRLIFVPLKGFQYYGERGGNSGYEKAFWPHSINFENPRAFDEIYSSYRNLSIENNIVALHVTKKTDSELSFIVQHREYYQYAQSCHFNRYVQMSFMDCSVAVQSFYSHLLTKSFISEISNGNLEINTQNQNYPIKSIAPNQMGALVETPALLTSGIFLFALTLMLPFPLIIFNISYEKAEGTHEMMSVVSESKFINF